ncbi:MAG: hypothetical protein L3J29_10560 [Cyclobacteriaceae bacterium]|nr:hypothetical protein [Cyclobacteriaceae bacterium]
MKVISIIALVFALSISVVAQPNYSVKAYRVKEGQKINKYAKAAKNFIKEAKYNEAAINGAYALKLATKKGQLSNAQEVLNSTYNRAFDQNKNRIEVLEENTESFEGDQTVTDLAEILRLYKTMRACNNILKEVPPASFDGAKKKDPGFHPEIEDFRNQIKVAKENLNKGKEDAAKMHYDDGRELESKGGKLNSRMGAKHYRWANEYSPNYRDANERYDAVRKLGTTRMGLMKFESSGSQYGDLGAIMSDKLLNYLSTKASQLEFFEVIDRNQLDLVVNEQQLALSGLMDESTTADIGELKGVDVLLVGNVTKSIIDRQRSGATSESYSEKIKVGTEKYLNDKGKEKTRDIYKTVYATANVYSKRADASVGGSYKVLDVKTGQVLTSGSTTGTDNWSVRWIGSFSGDARALPGLPRKEPNYPSYDGMINTSTNKAASQVFNKLLSYAEEVGK